MTEKEVSKVAAILQQAKGVLAVEITALASLKQEPSLILTSRIADIVL